MISVWLSDNCYWLSGGPNESISRRSRARLPVWGSVITSLPQEIADVLREDLVDDAARCGINAAQRSTSTYSIVIEDNSITRDAQTVKVFEFAFQRANEINYLLLQLNPHRERSTDNIFRHLPRHCEELSLLLDRPSTQESRQWLPSAPPKEGRPLSFRAA